MTKAAEFNQRTLDELWKWIEKRSTGCWVWSKPTKSKYGLIRISRDLCVGVHKISYVIHRGEIPDGIMVCHKCDIPRCINPDHLFLGTPKANIQDAIKKGMLEKISPFKMQEVKHLRWEHRLPVSLLAQHFNLTEEEILIASSSKPVNETLNELTPRKKKKEANRLKTRFERGICRRCNNPRLSNITTCEICSEKARIYQRLHIQEKKLINTDFIKRSHLTDDISAILSGVRKRTA